MKIINLNSQMEATKLSKEKDSEAELSRERLQKELNDMKAKYSALE